MSAQAEYAGLPTATAQAPSMVAVATQVGDPNEFGETPVLNLKMAVSRFDVARVEVREDKEVLVSFEDTFQSTIDYNDIPEQDLVYIFRAVDELRAHLSRSKATSGLDITIQKNIPFDTHLGGSAASAAAVLVALAALWDATVVREDLVRIAKRVGDGVADAITGGTLITHGNATEEVLTQLLVQHELAMVIVPAAADIATAEMLQSVRIMRETQQDDSDRGVLEFDAALLEAVVGGDAPQVALMMHNDFQSSLVSILPEHHDWLTAGMDAGALAAQTIGSGPSLIFLCSNLAEATTLAARFEEHMDIAAVAEYGPVAGAQLL